MNKAQFLKRLKRQLHNLKRSEREKYISDYEEMISDMVENGMTEQEAVSKLGNIKKISKEILENSEVTYEWVDGKGKILIVVSFCLILFSAFCFVKSSVSNLFVSMIGGADGPTSIFIAGKISRISLIYVLTGIAVMITVIYLVRRKGKGI